MLDNTTYKIKNDNNAPDLEENDVIVFRQNRTFQVLKNFGNSTIY